MLILNAILLVSIGLCEIGNIYLIAFGRFFWGLAAGSFSVYCPKFLSEYVPIELRGTFGGINQLAVCIGIATPALMSIALREDPKKSLKLDPNDWYVTSYWHYIWLFPAIISLIQVILLLTYFNFDTPVDLKVKGEHTKLHVLMCRSYQRNEVAARIE